MSKRHTCDNCDTVYAGDALIPGWNGDEGWMRLEGPNLRDKRDFCSFTCMGDYALRQPGVRLPAKRRTTPKTATVDQLAARRHRAAGA